MNERLEMLRNAIQEQIYDSVFIQISENEQRVIVRINNRTMNFETSFSFHEVMNFPYQVLAEKALNDYERKCYFKNRW